jgi:hypothetical protein
MNTASLNNQFQPNPQLQRPACERKECKCMPDETDDIDTNRVKEFDSAHLSFAFWCRRSSCTLMKTEPTTEPLTVSGSTLRCIDGGSHGTESVALTEPEIDFTKPNSRPRCDPLGELRAKLLRLEQTGDRTSPTIAGLKRIVLEQIAEFEAETCERSAE